MKAVSYPAYGVVPVLVDVPEPECPAGGVLVRVMATGVCRSDWHAWRGHDPVPLPMVPGHEFAGVVAAVGSGVGRWRVGDRVTVPFACGCGECEVCRAGDTHVCPSQTQPGFTGWGSFAEVVAVHAADANVVRLPDSVGFVEAAALGCRFATAYRAVVGVGRLAAGEWLAVHGCGGVGLSAVQIGVALGARVVALDVSTAAREAALALGAEVALDPAAPGGSAARSGAAHGSGESRASEGSGVARASEGSGAAHGSGESCGSDGFGGSRASDDSDASRGPDESGASCESDGSGAEVVAAAVVVATAGGAHLSIDAYGSVATMRASVLGLRPRGRHVQVGLLLGDAAEVGVPMGRVIGWELEVLGSHGMPSRDYPGMLDLVAAGRLEPGLLVGRVVGLAQAGDALAAMGAGDAGAMCDAGAAGMTVVEVAQEV